jgi:hypothetical protein
MSAILTIARAVWLETLHSRFWLIYGLALALAMGAALFIGQLVLTDPERTRVIVLAAMLRGLLAAQFILHVAAAINRETDEKGRDMVLAAGLSAPSLIAGRLLGYGISAAMMALGAGLLLMASGASHQLFIWGVGLGCELSLLAAFALAAALALRQVTSAALAAGVFYLLGHTIGNLLLLARHPMATYSDHAQSAVRWPLEAIAWLMPRLDLFGNADWLVGGDSGRLLPILSQTAIYLALMFAIAALDLSRNREPN